MTQALYRRYRPDTFEAVIGQDHVTEPLKAALARNRVNHAYLFSGPRGCGKTTSARILARCLNCAQGPTATPCGECESCRDLAQGGPGSIDVIEIDAASHGGVDDARDLRERATFAPARDRYKIFIIDEAHMVTSAGFNALLKIVEEPPEHILFIFATTEPDKVIGTIRSRTHHYPFRLVPPETLQNYLGQLCEQEGVQIEPGVLPLAIRAGAGSVRDTLSVLDQLIAGASAEGVTYERAVALLGYTHAALLDDVIEAFAAHDSGSVFRAVDRVIQTGQDPRRFVEDLLERFRDLIIVKAVPDSAASVLQGMSGDQLERLSAQASQLGPSELSRAADVVNAALTDMTGATSPRLHLELMCARMLLPAAEETQSSLAARLERVERRLEFDGAPASSGPAQTGAPQAQSGQAQPGQSPSAPSHSAQSQPGQSGARAGLSGAAAAREALRSSRERSQGRGEDAPRPQPAAQPGQSPQPEKRPEPESRPEQPAQPQAQSPSAQRASQSASAPASAEDSSARDWGGWPAVAEPSPAEAASAPASGQGDRRQAPAEEPASQRPQAESADAQRPSAQHSAPQQQPPSRQQSQQPSGQPAGRPPQQQPRQEPPRQDASQEPAGHEPAPSGAPAQRSGQGQEPQPVSSSKRGQEPSSRQKVDMLRRAWPDILEKLRGIRRATAIFAQQSHVVDVSGDNVVVGFPAAGAERGFNASHQENLAQAIYQALGIQVTITPIHHGGDAGPKAQAAPAADRKEESRPSSAAEQRSGLTQNSSQPPRAPEPGERRRDDRGQAQQSSGHPPQGQSHPTPEQPGRSERPAAGAGRQQPPQGTEQSGSPRGAQQGRRPGQQPGPQRGPQQAPQPSAQAAPQRSPWDAREPIPEEDSYFEDPYAPQEMPESTAWENVPENVDYSFPDSSTPFEDEPAQAPSPASARSSSPSEHRTQGQEETAPRPSQEPESAAPAPSAPSPGAPSPAAPANGSPDNAAPAGSAPEWLSPEELDSIPAPGGDGAAWAIASEPREDAHPAAQQAPSSGREPASEESPNAEPGVPQDTGSSGGERSPQRRMSAVERARQAAQRAASSDQRETFGAPGSAPSPSGQATQAGRGQPADAQGREGSGQPCGPPAAENGSGNGSRIRFDRLVAAQEAKAARIAQRWAQEAAAHAPARPQVEDVASDDDEMLEASSMHGRAAIERILGGRLEAERPADGIA